MSQIVGSTTSTSADWHDLFPYESKRFQLDKGVSQAFIDEGHGDPILMVHGNPTWSFYYYPLIGGMKRSNRCVAVDHVGCGRSDKPQQYDYSLDQHIENLVALIDHLQLKNITLVAHDWGGAIGMGAVRLRNDLFRRIVLLNTAAFPPPFFPLRIRACRMPLLGTAAVRGINLFARAAITMATERTGGLPAAEAAGLLAPYDSWKNRVAIDRFVRDIPTRSDQRTWQTLANIESSLSKLTIPKLLIWGMRDWCFRPECLDRFRGFWPEAKVVQFADAGHYVMLDKPNEVLAAIRDFMQTD